MAQKRTVTVEASHNLTVRDLILIAVLLAAGAVLKLTLASVFSVAGMKPNFMIAMYCLAIILVRPKLYQAALIGLMTGLISQIPFLNATPLVNIASETLGALVCGLLVSALGRAFEGRADAGAVAEKALPRVVFPAVTTFVATVVSGSAFAIIVGCGINHLALPVVLASYAVMVLGTAAFNAVFAAILAPVLASVLKR